MRRLVRRPGEPGTPRRATGAFAARLAGSVVGVAGITLMGAGTFGSPAGALAADRPSSTTSTNVCASDQECVQPTAVPSTGDREGCTAIAGLLKVNSLDSTDSYWHFRVPDSEGFEFNGTAFNASFSGANTEVTVTYVQQQKDNGYMGVVVEADGGVTLSWAWVPESGIMDESTEAEGTGAEDTDGSGDFVLSGTCAGAPSNTTTTASTSQTTSSNSSSTQSTTSTTQSTTTSSTSQSTTTSSTSQSTTSSGYTSSSSSSSTTSTKSIPDTTSSETSSQSTSMQSSTALTATVTDPSTSTTSTVSISSSSSASNPSTGVLGASTTTPSTGADVEFGFGIALLLGGAGVMIGATRINRNKRQ